MVLVRFLRVGGGRGTGTGVARGGTNSRYWPDAMFFYGPTRLYTGFIFVFGVFTVRGNRRQDKYVLDEFELLRNVRWGVTRSMHPGGNRHNCTTAPNGFLC